jgi:AcrR family transcriptional regulator
VAASGTNLGSIGYHYGSTEALLNAAMLAAIEEWGETFGRALAEIDGGDDARRLERFWERVIASFAADRALWLASIEGLLVSDRSPELRAQIADGQQAGRRGMVALLTGLAEETVDDQATRSLGSVQMALMSGVMVQWMTDPTRAPSATEVVAGLRALADVLPPTTGG